MAGSGFHEDFGRHGDVAAPAERSFGCTFAAVFAIAAIVVLWRSPENVGWIAALAVLAASFAGAAALLPSLLRPLNYVWFLVGMALHRVVNPLVMAALFFLVFTPAAIAMRLAGRSSGMPGLDRSAASYWKPRVPPGPDPATMPNQY